MTRIPCFVSWLLVFLLAHSGFAGGADAKGRLGRPDHPGPPKGRFDWTIFKGKYEIGECQISHMAIWGDGKPGTFVHIDHKVDYTIRPVEAGLELMRASNWNPLALGWSIARIDQGRRTETNAVTRKIEKVTESYATVDGVYGMMAWERPHNVGWSTMQLKLDAQRQISLTIRKRTDSDASTREETCILKKSVPDAPQFAS